MLIRMKKSWEICEREATPEDIFLNRRALLGGATTMGATAICGPFTAALAASPDLYPAKHNGAYTLNGAVTPEAVSSNYNNFTEFGSGKRVASAAKALKIDPWSIKIDGLVGKPQDISFDDLVKKMPLEERLYRHRCVETWAMAVPWTGFPLGALLALAEPKPEAQFVRFQTFIDPKSAPGQKSLIYPWPYAEGVTIEEAKNELAFLVTGAYGKPLANVFGAPLRLALPWKYGFKSIKSIVKISLLAEQPVSFWEKLQPEEYGFWANVNPAVAHTRWSQKTEEVLGTGERRPTLLFNGYAEQVAGLYADKMNDKIFY